MMNTKHAAIICLCDCFISLFLFLGLLLFENELIATLTPVFGQAKPDTGRWKPMLFSNISFDIQNITFVIHYSREYRILNIE